MTQGGRTVCYWYTKYPPGSLSASTVVSRCVCSQLLSHSVCGHSTIVAWCVRVIRQSSSPQTTIVGPTKVAWCVPSLRWRAGGGVKVCDSSEPRAGGGVCVCEGGRGVCERAWGFRRAVLPSDPCRTVLLHCGWISRLKKIPRP